MSTFRSPATSGPRMPSLSRNLARTMACVALVVAFVVAAIGCTGDEEDGRYEATPATNIIDSALASRLSFATTIAGTYCIASRLNGAPDIAALQAAGPDKTLDAAVAGRLAHGVEDCGRDLMITSVLARIGTTGVSAADISVCRTKLEAVQSSAVGSVDVVPVDVLAAHLADSTLAWSPAEVGC